MRALPFLLTVAFAATASAAPRRDLRPADGLRVVVTAVDDSSVAQEGGSTAAVELGRLAAGTCTGGDCSKIVTEKQINLRIEGARTARFVRVRAFLQMGSSGQRFFVDGRLLSVASTLVDVAMPVGVNTLHTLTVEVLPSAPQGQLDETIIWQVEDLR